MTGRHDPYIELPFGRDVKIQNTCPRWDGRIGRCVRWVHDSWYIVKVDNTELVLDESRSEFVMV